ncbi:kinase-like domain-containing protein [Mycena capillaripes]|nr:kinase-like domain-containing protein [Mycena capillaripes]
MAVTQNLPKQESDIELDGKQMRLVLLEISPDCSKFHLIGTTSYGTVYRAHHRALNRIVAVKLVRCPNVDGMSPTKYASDEHGPTKDFTLLQTIKHPHVLEILSIYRGGTCETTNVISEYVPGGTLFDYLQREYQKQRLNRGESCRPGIIAEMVCRDIMYQLSQAMAYVHRLGIVHRNLKLENILLSGDSIPFIKIAGFGLATRLPTNGEPLTEMRGSIDYMAPEMLREPPPGYDCRADSWSTGVILFEMLLLGNPYVVRRTYPEFTLPSLRWEQLRADKRLSVEGTELLERLLSPDPNLRFTLAAALAHRWLMYHRPMYPNVVYPKAA